MAEAASRPHMRFVPVKTAEQQGRLSVHRLRKGYKAERTALINHIRGALAEFRLVFPQSPQALRRVLADVIEDVRNELTTKQFGAWLGLVPSQNSAGGKASLGRITKRGDDYLRTLLIQGAKSAVMTAGKRSDRISQWPMQLKERVGWQKAVVALANKTARILWAVLTRDDAFDPNHLPEAPAPRCMLNQGLAR